MHRPVFEIDVFYFVNKHTVNIIEVGGIPLPWPVNATHGAQQEITQ